MNGGFVEGAMCDDTTSDPMCRLPVLVLPAIVVKRESSTLEEAVLGWAA